MWSFYFRNLARACHVLFKKFLFLIFVVYTVTVMCHSKFPSLQMLNLIFLVLYSQLFYFLTDFFQCLYPFIRRHSCIHKVIYNYGTFNLFFAIYAVYTYSTFIFTIHSKAFMHTYHI